jgi:hypothetical protein
MPLTASECRIAAERAKEYPPGEGNTYLPLKLTSEEVQRVLGYIPIILFDDSTYAAKWLRIRPEDADKG